MICGLVIKGLDLVLYPCTFVRNNVHTISTEQKDLLIFDSIETWKKTTLKGGTYHVRELLVPVFLKGECVYTSPSVMEIRDYCKKEQETLWDETRRLTNPHQVYVDLSDNLYDLKQKVFNELSAAKYHIV